MEITIPYQFDPTERQFQLEILRKPEKNGVFVIHRRAGKSCLAINKLILEAFENPGKLFWYIAPTYRQAKEIIWNNEMLFKHLPKQVIKKKNENELLIILTNGSRIALKGGDNPDSLRGANPYGVIIDEAQDQKESMYRDIIEPVLAANGGWAWFIGTPKSKNFFYKMYVYADEAKDWQRYTLSAEDSEIIPPDVLEEIKERTPMESYNNEYRAIFSDDDAMVFRNVNACASGSFTDPKHEQYQIGVDFGKKNDFTVITVYNCNTGKVDFIDRFNKIDYDFQCAKIETIARRYLTNLRPSRLKVDGTSLGIPIVDMLVKRGLIVDSVTFTNHTKEELVQNLILRFDKKDIIIPEYGPLINELEVFESKELPSGRLSYGHPEGLHDDCVWSLALAVWKTCRPKKNTSFKELRDRFARKKMKKKARKVESLSDFM